MRLVNQTKVFRCGGCDWIYAPTESEAYDFFCNLIGKSDADEILSCDPIEEISDEDFNNGTMIWDIDLPFNESNKISFQEALLRNTESGKLVGHFMTTEY